MTLGRVLTIVFFAACFLFGEFFVAPALFPEHKGLPGPVSSAGRPPTVSTPTTAPAGSTTTTTVPISLPVSLQIPEIGVSVPLGPPLGLTPSGTIEVPSGTVQPAWYEDGPSPGQIGSSVILGHVDSYLGPGVFFNLRELVPGNRFTVTLANGSVDTFEVTYVAQYEKTAFPSTLVYGSNGYAGLNLVTCGGIFDSATGHYLSNIVVFSKLVG
jgi:Sortase domain